MDRTSSYLSNYLFEWDLLDVVVSGKSALDSKFFVSRMYDEDQVNDFLSGYGFDPKDPVSRAELFGNFQESLQFVKRYFLKEGNPDGLDITIPNSLYMVTDIGDLFLMATGHHESANSDEERLWAEVLIKVMHTILHTDKDLRSNYFNAIQTQVFDRFYKYLYRTDDKLFIGVKDKPSIEILDFETKAKKTRESTILKLLHKAENVAEELFDRIGIRIVTKNKFDTLRVIKFYLEKNIVIPHNIKPSRSVNTIVDLKKFKELHQKTVKNALRSNYSEEDFLSEIENHFKDMKISSDSDRNKYSSSNYQSIQFTSRQLIKYRNPFYKEFNGLRKLAKESDENDPVVKKILSMDLSLISRDVRFFYPYEVQIVDQESHKTNTEGEASHVEYKKNQIQAAMKRVFKQLIELKGIKLN